MIDSDGDPPALATTAWLGTLSSAVWSTQRRHNLQDANAVLTLGWEGDPPALATTARLGTLGSAVWSTQRGYDLQNANAVLALDSDGAPPALATTAWLGTLSSAVWSTQRGYDLQDANAVFALGSDGDLPALTTMGRLGVLSSAPWSADTPVAIEATGTHSVDLWMAAGAGVRAWADSCQCRERMEELLDQRLARREARDGRRLKNLESRLKRYVENRWATLDSEIANLSDEQVERRFVAGHIMHKLAEHDARLDAHDREGMLGLIAAVLGLGLTLGG